MCGAATKSVVVAVGENDFVPALLNLQCHVIGWESWKSIGYAVWKLRLGARSSERSDGARSSNVLGS